MLTVRTVVYWEEAGHLYFVVLKTIKTKEWSLVFKCFYKEYEYFLIHTNISYPPLRHLARVFFIMEKT